MYSNGGRGSKTHQDECKGAEPRWDFTSSRAHAGRHTVNVRCGTSCPPSTCCYVHDCATQYCTVAHGRGRTAAVSRMVCGAVAGHGARTCCRRVHDPPIVEALQSVGCRRRRGCGCNWRAKGSTDGWANDERWAAGRLRCYDIIARLTSRDKPLPSTLCAKWGCCPTWTCVDRLMYVARAAPCPCPFQPPPPCPRTPLHGAVQHGCGVSGVPAAHPHSTNPASACPEGTGRTHPSSTSPS